MTGYYIIAAHVTMGTFAMVKCDVFHSFTWADNWILFVT